MKNNCRILRLAIFYMAVILYGVVEAEANTTNATANATTFEVWTWHHNFKACHAISKADTIWTHIGKNKLVGNDSDQDTSSTERLFCRARSDATFMEHGQCCPALKLSAGRKRTLELQKSVGNLDLQLVKEDVPIPPDSVKIKKNLTKEEYKKYYHDMKIQQRRQNEFKRKNKTKKANSTSESAESQTNNTTEEQPYFKFENYKEQSDIGQYDPLWILNLTNVKYGYSQPAFIDPDFPYLQISQTEFNGIFKDHFPGFKQVLEPSPYQNEQHQQTHLKKYVASQPCKVLLGCYESQNLLVTGVHQENATQLNFTFSPLDFLISSFASNGSPQCTIGITTCADGDFCPTTLGQVFLKNFDTVLDYNSNSVSMRVSEKDDFKGNQNLCWGTFDIVKPRTLKQQFLDWFLHYYNGFIYLANPVNLYYELWENPKTIVWEVEMAAAVSSILIPITLLFFASIYLFVQLLVWFMNWHDGTHYKLLF